MRIIKGRASLCDFYSSYTNGPNNNAFFFWELGFRISPANVIPAGNHYHFSYLIPHNYLNKNLIL